jgi:hypothetical protein
MMAQLWPRKLVLVLILAVAATTIDAGALQNLLKSIRPIELT